LTHALAQAVFRVRALGGYKLFVESRGKSVKQSRVPGSAVCKLFGGRVREALGVFLYNLIEACERAQQRTKTALRVPFADTTDQEGER
jgi:hypothetical protein